MKSHAMPLWMSLVATLAAAGSAHAQSPGGQTHGAGGPADVEHFQVVTGFAQSFEITRTGSLTTIEIDADWKADLAGGSFEWKLFEDVPNGTLLDSNTFDSPPGGGNGSGPRSFAITPVDVTAGDTLVFMVRQVTPSTANESTLHWWVGDDTATDPYDAYPDGQGFARDSFDNYLTGTDFLGYEFDLRLRAFVVPPVTGPCATDSTAPVINTDTSIEVPVGTTQVTLTGGIFEDNLVASVTVDGILATLVDPGPTFLTTLTVAGPGSIVVDVIAVDGCGNESQPTQVTIDFVAVCAPEFDMCLDGNLGTAFYIDVIGPTGATCQLSCSTNAQGLGLGCSLPPVCPPVP